jgi:hypothetical protein
MKIKIRVVLDGRDGSAEKVRINCANYSKSIMQTRLCLYVNSVN